MKLNVIYMAAGNGRRFKKTAWEKGYQNENKLLFSYQGKPLYRHVLDRLIFVCREKKEQNIRIYVVSQYRELLEELSELPVIPVYSPGSREGISYTIKAGIEAATKEVGCAFFTADQPQLSEKTIGNFFDAIEKAYTLPVAVGKDGTMGNPCYFPPQMIPDLLLLEGDQGGKKVLQAKKEKCHIVEVQEENELWDLDEVP